MLQFRLNNLETAVKAAVDLIFAVDVEIRSMVICRKNSTILCYVEFFLYNNKL